MFRRIYRWVFGRSRSQTFVLVIILLPVFIGVMGLASDVAYLYYTYYQLQTADDASVLAGAHCLPSEDSCKAVDTAKSFATLNGVAPGEISSVTVGTWSDGNPDISMSLRRVLTFYFAGLIGFPQSPVQVSSTAEIGPAGTVYNGLPLGLQVCLPSLSTCSYSPGVTVVKFAAKKNESHTWVDAPGNWSRLDLPYATPSNTVSICPPPSASAPCVSSDPGWSKTRDIVDEAAASLINQNVVVPLVDWTGAATGSPCHGSCSMYVYGFAEIKILSAVDNGPDSSYITGQFVNYVNPGLIGPGGNNVGAFAEKLVN